MAKFRKKPVVIEAVQWTGDNWVILDKFTQGRVSATWNGSRQLIVMTREGRMFADAGDWIIKGIKGEVYPCKPDIFTATYEPLPDDGAA